jgi:hypothetical protein
MSGARMFHSRSMPDLDSINGSSSCKSSFESGPKGSGRLIPGDSRHAELFVRDNLTSPKSGFAPAPSPLAGIFELQHGQKPMSKYDPNTGKFYRSVTMDTAGISASLSALSLLSLFSGDEMRYDTATHTGVVLNIAGQFTVTCVGDTHVQADAMYAKVQETLAALAQPMPEDGEDDSEAQMQSVMGISLLQGCGKGPVEKDCELVADSCAGLTLFSDVKGMSPSRACDDCCQSLLSCVSLGACKGPFHLLKITCFYNA